MITEIKIPDLGENVVGGRVVSLTVKIGDLIEIDQPLFELETDKAVIEVPSPVKGKITDIKIADGDEVSVGMVTMIVEEDSSAEEKSEPQQEAEKVLPPVAIEEPDQDNSEPISELPEETNTLPVIAKRNPADIAPAAPSVRRFAREIGISIDSVPGSGPAGRISKEDVKRYSKQLNARRGSEASGSAAIFSETLPDFEKFGSIERKRFSKLRETAAKHLSYAWATIPHVTQFDQADITNLEKLRKQYSPLVAQAGGKLTVTAILIKVIEKALKKFPSFNTSIDMNSFEIIYKNYFNIGVAVDTEHGLVVPVVKDVNQKDISQLAIELTQISEKSRQRKLSLDDMQGGNFTISNLGGIGGTGFTPVVNSPEVAILGVSRSQIQPVYLDGTFVPRLIMPLSLSYDHRIIDGAAAARFLRWVCEALEEPFLLSI